MTREERMNNVTEMNKLGLQEYDLVQTAGKGIGIVLRKKSLNDELVIYSMSSASETHPNDDDGMEKVRRYNEDGTIDLRSERTGRRLRNRGIYTITGIKSYVNPVLAMKDFINQNEDIEFDPVIEEEDDDIYDDYDDCDCDCDYDDYDDEDNNDDDEQVEQVEQAQEQAAVTQQDINLQILSVLDRIVNKLDNLG